VADTKELLIKLTMQNEQLLAANKKAQKSFDTTKKKGKSLKDTIGNLKAGYLAAAAAVGLLARQALKSIKAFAEQERVENLLNAAFAKTSTNANQLTRDFAKFAAEQQKVTRFGDEVTISAAAQLQALAGLSGEGLQDAIKATQDFAVAQGVDLKTAALLVGKTIGSSTNALSRYGIEIGKSNNKNDRLNNIVTVMREKFGGFAEREGKTAAGRMEQISNFAGDVSEAIGKELLGSLSSAEGGFDFLQKAETIINGVRRGMRALITVVRFLALQFTTLGKIAALTITPFIDLFKNFRRIVDEVKSSFVSLGGVVDIIRDKGLGGMKEALSLIKDEGSDVGDTIKDSFTGADSASRSVAESIKNEYLALGASFTSIFAKMEEDNTNFTETTILNNELINESEADKTKKAEDEAKKRMEAAKKEADFKAGVAASAFSAFAQQAEAEQKITKEALKEGLKATITAIASELKARATASLASAFLLPPVVRGRRIAASLSALAGVNAVEAIGKVAISKFQDGGIISGLPGGGPGNEDGIIAAQNGEAVLNRQATAVLGADAIQALNEGRGVGASNVTINVADGRGAVEMLDDYFKTRGTSERGLSL
jgi:hypothetical protein